MYRCNQNNTTMNYTIWNSDMNEARNRLPTPQFKFKKDGGTCSQPTAYPQH